MSDQRVRVDITDHVAHVRLDRPDKRNGLDLAMFEAIARAGASLARTPGLRAVVLSGEGPAFCAGLDVKSFFGAPDAFRRLGERDPGPANLAQQVAWVWKELPVPVIAAVHGACFGGGLQIALGCDLRYVRPDAQLSVMEIKWGLVPDMSASKTLLELVRLDVAKELTFTGRVVSGEEAVRLGLATRVSDDPLADALETARAIAARSPHAIRAAKRLYDDAAKLEVADAFRLETELQVALIGSRNQIEAVSANLQKRAPRFVDPEVADQASPGSEP